MNLHQLLEQKNELEKQIAAARKSERAGVIAQIKELMDQHGLTVLDLGLRNAHPQKNRKVAVKYRDKLTGSTWSGRGLQPRWLVTALQNGHKLEDFAV